MKKLMFTLAAASLAGLVQADWIQTGAGPYDYNGLLGGIRKEERLKPRSD